MPQLIDLHAGLLTMHMLGLALGLGGALMLDLYACQFLVRRKIGTSAVEIFAQLSVLVAVGLGLLWISGAALLVRAVSLDPGALADPRIWAKLSIVFILTLNGIVLHRKVFPRIATQVGRRLFDAMSRRERCACASAGAISSVSWLFPMLFACVERCHSMASSAQLFGIYFGTYAVCVLLAAMVARALASRWSNADRETAARTVPLHAT